MYPLLTARSTGGLTKRYCLMVPGTMCDALPGAISDSTVLGVLVKKLLDNGNHVRCVVLWPSISCIRCLYATAYVLYENSYFVGRRMQVKLSHQVRCCLRVFFVFHFLPLLRR